MQAEGVAGELAASQEEVAVRSQQANKSMAEAAATQEAVVAMRVQLMVEAQKTQVGGQGEEREQGRREGKGWTGGWAGGGCNEGAVHGRGAKDAGGW